MKKLKKLNFNNGFTILSVEGMKAVVGGESTCVANASTCDSKATCYRNGVPYGGITCKPINGGCACY